MARKKDGGRGGGAPAALDSRDLLEVLSGLGPEGIRQLEEVVKLEKLRASRDAVPEQDEGTPRDAAVQKLAGHFLRFLRQPDYRAYLARSLEPEPLAYEKIAETFTGTSRERVRKLYEMLRPHDYASEKQDRGTGTGG